MKNTVARCSSFTQTHTVSQTQTQNAVRAVNQRCHLPWFDWQRTGAHKSTQSAIQFQEVKGRREKDEDDCDNNENEIDDDDDDDGKEAQPVRKAFWFAALITGRERAPWACVRALASSKQTPARQWPASVPACSVTVSIGVSVCAFV